jgi:hypothetical protein
MIDDGLHTFEAGVTLYESARSMLSRVGVYVIEDVNAACLIKYYNYFADKNVTVDFVNLYRSGLVLGDNSLVVIREGL